MTITIINFMRGVTMKQSKKLTRSQRIFLEKECGFQDVVGVRCIEETKDYLKVQLFSGNIVTYDKQTGGKIS